MSTVSGRDLWRACALYAALTILLAYPLSIHPASSIASFGPDTDLYIWTLAWDAHALVHQPWHLFDANIFFPFHNTLAYSENLLGSAVVAAPVIWITHNPVLALNLVVLSAAVLSALGAYLLARRVGTSPAAAVLAGIVYGFAAPRFLRIDQAHLATVQWVPFSLAYLHAYFKDGRPRDLRLAIAFFSMQAVTSGHGAAFLGLGLAVVVFCQLATGGWRRAALWVRDAGIPGAVALVPAILIYLPYRVARVEVGLKRELDDWSISSSSWLAGGTHVQDWIVSHLPKWGWLQADPQALLFPGVVTLLLATMAFLPRLRAQESDHGGRLASVSPSELSARLPYLAIVLLSIWLVIGPPFGVWRWAQVLPGLDFVRVPSRFTEIGLLGLAVLAAVGLDRATAGRRAAARRSAAWIAGALMVAEFAAIPFGTMPYAVKPPAIDRWLGFLPKPFAAVEIPAPGGPGSTSPERMATLYMLHATAHWQPIVEGYSGIAPPGYDDLMHTLAGFPDDASRRALTRLGVTYVVVHREFFDADTRAAIDRRLTESSAWLTYAHAEGDDRVYALKR